MADEGMDDGEQLSPEEDERIRGQLDAAFSEPLQILQETEGDDNPDRVESKILLSVCTLNAMLPAAVQGVISSVAPGKIKDAVKKIGGYLSGKWSTYIHHLTRALKWIKTLANNNIDSWSIGVGGSVTAGVTGSISTGITVTINFK